jgi:hypothetical protein
MDQPKTRKESKKDQKEKAKGKSIYSQKHIRLLEAKSQKPGVRQAISS